MYDGGLVKNVFLFYFEISHLLRSIQCLLVIKHASAEYATNTFSSKEKYEKLAVVVHVLQTTQNLVISRRSQGT